MIIQLDYINELCEAVIAQMEREQHQVPKPVGPPTLPSDRTAVFPISAESDVRRAKSA